jgi:hypothetical protein
MIYEHRTYRLRNGAVPEYFRLVESEGIAIQRKHLGNLIGYFTTEIGPLNQIVHIWAFEDLADRTRRRAALAADPAWLAFVPKIQVLIETAENKILKPAPFSPLT